MPEVIFAGPAGRMEGRYTPGKSENAPIALMLHAHPRAGGSMLDRVTVGLSQVFASRGFGVLRFNFRGVGRSQGVFDNGQGELSDAATALDYLQSLNADARACWVAGHSFGAWIGLQLLMRRPEIDGFISVSPPANHYDLSFLAPCPSSGIIIYGTEDKVAPPHHVERAIQKIRTQKHIIVERQAIEGANHFFENHLDKVIEHSGSYLDRRLNEVTPPQLVSRGRAKPGAAALRAAALASAETEEIEDPVEIAEEDFDDED